MTLPIKKKDLISIVQSMKGFRSPDVQLEQYVTDAISTVDFLYYIAIDNQDVAENVIVDLGAGTGRLGLTSLLLGAKSVVALEKDEKAIQILMENAQELELTSYLHIHQVDISFISPDEIKQLHYEIRLLSDQSPVICIMNPPFGVQKRLADRPFLDLAMNLSDTIYSIHLSHPKIRNFMQKYLESHGWLISSLHSQKIVLESTFSFHKKNRKSILADVYKIEKKSL